MKNENNANNGGGGGPEIFFYFENDKNNNDDNIIIDDVCLLFSINQAKDLRNDNNRHIELLGNGMKGNPKMFRVGESSSSTADRQYLLSGQRVIK